MPGIRSGIVRIALNEDDFDNLVAGNVVKPLQVSGLARGQGCEIILSDIGFERMLSGLKVAIARTHPFRRTFDAD